MKGGDARRRAGSLEEASVSRRISALDGRATGAKTVSAQGTVGMRASSASVEKAPAILDSPPSIRWAPKRVASDLRKRNSSGRGSRSGENKTVVPRRNGASAVSASANRRVSSKNFDSISAW